MIDITQGLTEGQVINLIKDKTTKEIVGSCMPMKTGGTFTVDVNRMEAIKKVKAFAVEMYGPCGLSTAAVIVDIWACSFKFEAMKSAIKKVISDE